MVIVKSQIQGAPEPHEASMIVEVRQTTAKLGWNKLIAALILANCYYKKEMLTGNLTFPLPWPSNVTTLVAYALLLVTLQNAITARESGVKGSAKALKDALKAVKLATKSIMTMVQTEMDKYPVSATQICTDAGFDYYVAKGGKAKKTGAFKSTEPGVLVVQITGGGQQQFQMSTNEGETFTTLDPVTCASTMVRGLISKKEYWFRGRRVLTKGRYGEWTLWFSEFAP